VLAAALALFFAASPPAAVPPRVERAAAARGVEPEILAAIVMQESGFRRGLLRCVPSASGALAPFTCDMGLGQINDLWITKWGLDPNRLRRDDDYNLAVAARILGDLRRRYAAVEPTTWYSRYHSVTPKKRWPYQARIDSWLAMFRQPSVPCSPPVSVATR
jgi:hypothetical protein